MLIDVNSKKGKNGSTSLSTGLEILGRQSVLSLFIIVMMIEKVDTPRVSDKIDVL